MATVDFPETSTPAGGLVHVANTDANTSAKHLFVPEGKVWDLQSLHYKLIASGDAANRQTTIKILNQDRVEVYTIDAAAVSIASSTEFFNAIMGGDTPLETVATFHFLPLPNPTLLLPGWELEVLQSSGSDDGTQSQGTLTIAEPVTALDTFTINGVTFTLVTALSSDSVVGLVANEILIGANEAATKVNIDAALGGTPSGYGTLHTVTTAARQSLLVEGTDFSGDAFVLTAVHAGTLDDALTLAETFTHASNVFDAATMGTTTAGANADDAGTLNIIVREYSV